jgi:predicted dehydrogenase
VTGAKRREAGVAILGAGFMGSMHAAALRQLQVLGDQDAVVPRLVAVADSDPLAAEELAARFEIPMWTTDWRSLIDDPRVDVVTIATPNNVHVDMAVEAARCGKHVYCEKPLGTDLSDARRALDAVTDAGVTTLVAFSYLFNPVQAHVRSVLQQGDLGEVISFRGTFDQDLLVDPSAPFNWRMDRAVAGPGALADLGAHVIAIALHLVGPLAVVSSMMRTLVPSRQVSIGAAVSRAVENEDEAYLLGRFASGATCVIGASRVATGRKVGLSYEIQCTRGSVTFTHERMNEFGLYRHDGPADRGYTRILTGPSHGQYGRLYPIAGVGLGFGDQKVLESAALFDALASGVRPFADFHFATEVTAVVEAAERSAEQAIWMPVEGATAGAGVA